VKLSLKVSVGVALASVSERPVMSPNGALGICFDFGAESFSAKDYTRMTAHPRRMTQ